MNPAPAPRDRGGPENPAGAPRRIVVVGASLAGLRAAETLRDAGFDGSLTVIGAERERPYDRPPLSKQALLGPGRPDRTGLPTPRDLDADWRLGTAAVRLDRSARRVHLANGDAIGFDRLLVATGRRARPWFNAAEAALDGVLTLRTAADAAFLRAALCAGPQRVVIAGGGFTGSELASTCRALDLPTTLVERSAAPLSTALGRVVGDRAAALQRSHGVDLRCGTAIEAIEADAQGHVRQVRLTGRCAAVRTELVIVALGSIPNVEWLEGSGLAAGPHGLACDVAGRAFDRFGVAGDAIWVAGDVARFPHPVFNYEFMSLEHWSNADSGARIVARNMVRTLDADPAPHAGLPTFWSSQFDVSIKSVGVPAAGDEVAFSQGSPEAGAFVATYGRRGRIVAAVSFDHGRWLPHYAALIDGAAAFPPPPAMDPPADPAPVPAGFPHPAQGGLSSFITLSGYQPAGPAHAVAGSAA